MTVQRPSGMAVPEKADPCVVEIAEVPETLLNPETLKMFFENASITGGGPVEDIEIDTEKRVAKIRFQDEEGTCNFSNTYLTKINNVY